MKKWTEVLFKEFRVYIHPETESTENAVVTSVAFIFWQFKSLFIKNKEERKVLFVSGIENSW